MTVWLFSGKTGEIDKKFLEDERVYLTWDELNN